MSHMPSSPTTLLWLHGLGESSRCFSEIIAHPALAATRALAPDLPGYGSTEWPAEPRSLADIADHLAVWLRQLAVRPILVGHSMGGVIGVLLAERHPDAIAHLVDVDGNVSIGDCGFSGRAAAVDLTTFILRGFAELQASVAEGGATDRALAGYHSSMVLADPRSFHAHALELVEISEPETMATRLARLPVPVTYIAGSPGGACPRSCTLLDAKDITRVDIAPAGHWPFIDRPDQFAAALAGVVG